MVPGPVFQLELLTTARRGRYYLIRSAYGLVLLLILWQIHSVWAYELGRELSASQVGWVAFSALSGIAIGQLVLVLILTPALVAGVIADEKQRKTLHYLLASQLSGPEIVVGKLMARMLHVAVLLAVSFPVLSLLVLLGGIDPRLIVLACAAAASTAWFLAALSVWVSTIAGRVREALFITYGLESLWLLLPFMLPRMVFTGWPALDAVISWFSDWAMASSPLELGRRLIYSLTAGSNSLEQDASWMIGIQLVAGAILAFLAAIQVRSVFRAQEGAGTSRRFIRGFSARWGFYRVLPRPKLGDRPMIWKELFTARTRGLARLVAVLVTLIGVGYLLYYTLWYGQEAYLEMIRQGYRPNLMNAYGSQARWWFFTYLSIVIPLVFLPGLLLVIAAAASSITSEHEEDTWTSLTATDLTAREIVVAKILGALWRPRGIVLTILLLTFAGISVGAIHPLSLAGMLVSLMIFGWFAAALGVWVSLHLRSTWRAQFLAVCCLLLVNVVGQSFLSNVQRWAPLMWPGFMPYELSKVILSPWSVEAAASSSVALHWPRAVEDTPVWSAGFSLISLAGYSSGALLLTFGCFSRFESVAGRPRANGTKTVAYSPSPADLSRHDDAT